MEIKPIIASRDGKLGIKILRFDGADKILNRDAVGYYYTVLSTPEGEPTRVVVLYSGTVRMIEPASIGLPDSGDQKRNFQLFAEARIGDFLDEDGPLPFMPDKPFEIECFSSRLDEWSKRKRVSDDAIEAYLRGKAFWAWKYDEHYAEVGVPDQIRTNGTRQQFFKVIQLHADTLWKVTRNGPSFLLSPLSDLVHVEREKRKERTPDVTATPRSNSVWVFVDPERLEQLKQIQSSEFDLRKLIRLCEELNVATANEALLSVAMLTRALVDHVPPIFGYENFKEVANNYGGEKFKSFKATMSNLDNFAKKIADNYLHGQIRKKEVLPNRTQVDFSQSVDVLLAEIVRVLS